MTLLRRAVSIIDSFKNLMNVSTLKRIEKMYKVSFNNIFFPIYPIFPAFLYIYLFKNI